MLGAGGVGGYFGGRLAAAGKNVTFLARGAHLEALRRDGLRLRSAVHGDCLVKIEAAETLAGRDVADVVLVCVKSFDTECALAAAKPIIGPDTLVLSLQNGIDGVDRIEALIGRSQCIAGVAYVFAALAAPGVLDHHFGGRIMFGELDGRSTLRIRALQSAFAGAGVAAELSPDIRRILWEKYLFICAQAGVTALARCTIGVARENSETWRLYRRIVEELRTLAAASGVDLSPDTVEKIMRAAEHLPPDSVSSLANDLARGKRLELDALHGTAVRRAEILGVSMPTVFAAYAALKPHQDGHVVTR